MKLINKNTGKTLYEVLGGENLTLDEAIEWAGAEVMKDPTPGDPECIINGEECWYDELLWLPDELADRQVEAIELAKEIRESDEWDNDKLARLCELANMSEEWEAADGETFESIAYEAAEELGVEI